MTSRAGFVLARIDESVVRELARAWQKSKNGLALEEALVLIFRMGDGSIKAVQGGWTNEAKRFTFEWSQAIYAIVHTHPNKSFSEPQDADIAIADRFQVPMFTITNKGMFLYDPSTKTISTVLESLDWLKPEAWARYSQVTGKSYQ